MSIIPAAALPPPLPPPRAGNRPENGPGNGPGDGPGNRPAAGPDGARPADGGPPLREDEHVPTPGEISFRQILQGLNPLHHLPGVGIIYRAATGAEIHPTMRVLGGALFGGPIGMMAAAAGAALDETRPFERLGAALAGRPDPQGAPPAGTPTPAQVAAAYARHGGRA